MIYKLCILVLLSVHAGAQSLSQNNTTQAVNITVDNTRLILPNPIGFGLITPKMTEVYEMQSHFISEQNLQFACFIPKAQIQQLGNEPLPKLSRTFRVQTPKGMETEVLTSEQFLKLKESVRKTTDEAFKEVASRQMAKENTQLEITNNELIELLKYDPDLSLKQAILVKGMEENKQSISFSMLMKSTIDDDKGQPKVSVGCGTITYLLIKNKLLFLYAFGEEKDLEWTRTMSKQWATSIISANSLSSVPQRHK
jgi:hypothetical protein